MNNNQFDKKIITVPIPKIKTYEDRKREQEEIRNKISFPNFDYDEFLEELESRKTMTPRKYIKDGYKLQIPECKNKEDEYEFKSGVLNQNRPSTINRSLGDFTSIYESQKENEETKVKKLKK